MLPRWLSDSPSSSSPWERGSLMPRGVYLRSRPAPWPGFVPFSQGRCVGYVVDTQTGCWNWKGCTSKKGYGRLFIAGKLAIAHRVYYERVHGKIPNNLQIDHLCRNRSCVNPSHLEAVTLQENQARGAWAAKTHCPQGHPYEGKNLIIWRNRRQCRECARIHKRSYKAKTKEAAARAS